MLRILAGIQVFALCLEMTAYPYAQSKDFSKDVQAVQGLWVGSYGGGQRDGVTYQPAIAELFIQETTSKCTAIRAPSLGYFVSIPRPSR